MIGGRPGQGCVTIQSLYRDRREAWPLWRCIVIGGRPGRWGVCHNTIGCIVTGEGLATRVCRDTPYDTTATWLRHGTQRRGYDTAEVACDTVLGLRYDTLHATTWPRHGRPRCSARDMCAQAGLGCAPGAPNSVLTQCIKLVK